MGRYVGKYCKKKRIPLVSWLLIVLAVLSLTVGGVVAYLSASTEAVTNSFLAEQPTDPEVLETFAGNSKTNVKVDVGDPGYAVYVRVAVVVTWKSKENGDVFPQSPKLGEDYTLSVNTTDWFKGADGFYYHKAMVNSAADTAVLIQECKSVDGKNPSGYNLNVEIIAQTIQALGTTDADGPPPVTAEWGIPVENGQLKNPAA